ncbi:MAG TPA: type II secretion system major pseudopilin GspG [Tepidisphaeraceae bacterium]|nr:type II secretion system major pseudopilin GspG [Tepidisphaeraceae bacterium]
MRSVPNRVRAFTLIELLLVMVILVILASVVVPMFPRRTDDARKTRAMADVSSLETAISTFNVDCGRYPSNDEGLLALTKNPGMDDWKGPYLKLVPIDPWGNSYVYHVPGTHLPDMFDLYSYGPDKQEGNDDIGNWQR